jgi:flavin reductase
MAEPVDPTLGPPVDPVAYRRTLGQFATGVTVVTTALDDILHGMTANAFTSVSLDPRLVLVCVDRSAGLHQLLERSRSFAANILADDQEEAARWFAWPHRPDGRDQFDQWPWTPAPASAAPLLRGCLAYVDCTLHSVADGGDHSIFVGAVEAVGNLGGQRPLLFYDGSYRHLDDRASTR